MLSTILCLILGISFVSAGADEYCQQRITATSGEIEFPHLGGRKLRWYARHNNMTANCVYLKQFHETSRPAYFTLTVTELAVGDDPLQVKVKVDRSTRWKIHTSLSNYISSSITIRIPASKYSLVKIIVPKSLESLHMHFIEEQPLETNAGVISNPLLGFCGVPVGPVDTHNCSETEEELRCTFQCHDGYFPTFIEGGIYPNFTGYCRRDRSKNWPSKVAKNPMCVAKQEVIENCLSEGANPFLCSFEAWVMLIWFDGNTTLPDQGISAYPPPFVCSTPPPTITAALEEEDCEGECKPKKCTNMICMKCQETKASPCKKYHAVG